MSRRKNLETLAQLAYFMRTDVLTRDKNSMYPFSVISQVGPGNLGLSCLSWASPFFQLSQPSMMGYLPTVRMRGKGELAFYSGEGTLEMPISFHEGSYKI